MKHGIDPRKHFRRMMISNHEANCVAVANGQLDVATSNDQSLRRFAQESPELAARLRVIWTSPEIPNDPIVWRSDLPPALKENLRVFFSRYGADGPDAEREREVLAGIADGWGPFRPADNSLLLPVRELVIASELLKLEASETVDAERKAKETARLKAALEAIRRQSEGRSGAT
jgi:phosphonate transport system substrate-binding protein